MRQVIGDACRDAPEDVLSGGLALLTDKAGDPRLGGFQDTLLFEKLPSSSLQGRALLQAARLLEHERLQQRRLRRAEVPHPQVDDDGPLVLGDRLASSVVVLDQRGIDAELNGGEVHEIVDDFEGLLLGEAVQEANEGELVAEAQPVLRPPASADLDEIFRRQAGVALELVAGTHGGLYYARSGGSYGPQRSRGLSVRNYMDLPGTLNAQVAPSLVGIVAVDQNSSHLGAAIDTSGRLFWRDQEGWQLLTPA